MAITNNFIDATLTTLYTSSGQSAITSMIFCNYQDTDNISGTPGNVLTDADTFLDLHVVPNGGSAGDENKILHQLKIPGGETFIMDTERLVLENGDTIVAQTTSPATISATISTVAV
jgi:hypothetical protein|tara:strand:- start:1334 stop:1684 length:351 start_codon:yes stop_codon:yes gene_type:complete